MCLLIVVCVASPICISDVVLTRFPRRYDPTRLARVFLAVGGWDKMSSSVAEFGRFLGLPSEFANTLNALVQRDVPNLDRALSDLIVLLCRPYKFDEEGLVKGIVGVFRGDVSVIPDLCHAMRIEPDIAEAMMTLSMGE
mgnify:CR=1 FL=1